MFNQYLKQFSVKEVHRKLPELFKVLDITKKHRDEYDSYMDDELAAFPYVNGGIFTDKKIAIPSFKDCCRWQYEVRQKEKGCVTAKVMQPYFQIIKTSLRVPVFMRWDFLLYLSAGSIWFFEYLGHNHGFSHNIHIVHTNYSYIGDKILSLIKSQLNRLIFNIKSS